MSATIRIPTPLRNVTGGTATVSVEPGSLAEVLGQLTAAHPGIAERLLDDQGRVRRFVNLYVDDQDIRFGDGLATVVGAGSVVSIIPAVAGG